MIDVYESMKQVGIVSESGYYKDVERAIRHIKGFIKEQNQRALLLMNMLPGKLEFILVHNNGSKDLQVYVDHWMNILRDERPANEELFLTWWDYSNLPEASIYLEGWTIPSKLQFDVLMDKTECIEFQPALTGITGNPVIPDKDSIWVTDEVKRKFSLNLIKALSRI